MKAGSRLAKRAVHVEASIRTRMLELASALDDVVPLGRGDPDLDTPPAIVREGVRALEEGETHYTGPAGLPALRQAISSKLDTDNGLSYSPGQVIVTNGCQEALLVSMMSVLDPGDEVILQAPRFNAFDHMANLAGAAVVSVPTTEANDFALKADDIAARLTDRTKLLVVANPNNPTGSVIDDADLEAIAALAVERDLLVLSDEIYEKLLFDGRTHTSLASFSGMPERTITINGFSKAYAMTGWRVGYLAGPEWLMESAIEIKHTISICTPPAMQLGALAALRAGDEAVSAMAKEYEARRDIILRELDALGLTYGHPGGAMYIYANVTTTGMDAETFCFELLKQEQVMIFPGTLFADDANEHVRITVLSPRASIEEALRRLSRFISRARSS